jgi:hypothetical protein
VALLLRRQLGDVHALEGNPDSESDMTKKEASLRLQVIAAEIRLQLDEDDEDCPSWPDDLVTIALALYGGGE